MSEHDTLETPYFMGGIFHPFLDTMITISISETWLKGLIIKALIFGTLPLRSTRNEQIQVEVQYATSCRISKLILGIRIKLQLNCWK